MSFPPSPPPGRSNGATPRFSIVIPAYNEEFYLGDCLRSLQQQDFPGTVEVIVVDNDSSDGTGDVARAAGVTVIRHTDRGVCQARQCGTDAAAGTIIVSADADTIYPTGWLSAIDGWFSGHPEAIAVGGPCFFHDGPRWGLLLQQVLFGVVALVQRLGGPVLYITATNFAFLRSAFPGYDVRLTQGGDELDLLRRLRREGLVRFDATNPATTSARRMERGAAYNFAVSFFYYYILGYAVNRLLGRPVLGMAPAFRHVPPSGGAAAAGRMPSMGGGAASTPDKGEV